MQSVLQAARLGIHYLTLHLSGGRAMLETVMAELQRVKGAQPKVFGVSVLTSFDEKNWSEVSGASGSGPGQVETSVKNLVRLADSCGLDGVVCSPHELEQVRKQFPRLKTLVPGIRPEGSDKGDQRRVMTPQQAAQLGADFVVVGRPITQAADVRASAQAVLDELMSVNS